MRRVLVVVMTNARKWRVQEVQEVQVEKYERQLFSYARVLILHSPAIYFINWNICL